DRRHAGRRALRRPPADDGDPPHRLRADPDDARRDAIRPGSGRVNSSEDMRPTDLRGILRYVPQFREKTFVVAVDGAVVADDNFGNLLMDVAVLWSLNIRTVLVHGASAQIQALAEEKVAEPSDLEASGVPYAETPDRALRAAN